MKRPISFRPALKIKFQLLLVFFLAVFFAQAQTALPKKTMLERKVEWRSGDHKFSDVLKFNFNDYNFYKGLPKQQTYSKYAADFDSHSYLLTMAKVLDADAQELRLSRAELGQYIIDFVQQAIPYKRDPENNGYDYPKYPIETIVETGGDCEDKAALLVALLNTFGFDALFIQFEDHMGVGLQGEKSTGSYYPYNGKKYYYVESTAAHWRIGMIPPEYKTAAMVVPAPQVKLYTRGVAESSTVASATPEENTKPQPASKTPLPKTQNTPTAIATETRPTIIIIVVRR